MKIIKSYVLIFYVVAVKLFVKVEFANVDTSIPGLNTKIVPYLNIFTQQSIFNFN